MGRIKRNAWYCTRFNVSINIRWYRILQILQVLGLWIAATAAVPLTTTNPSFLLRGHHRHHHQRVLLPTPHRLGITVDGVYTLFKTDGHDDLQQMVLRAKKKKKREGRKEPSTIGNSQAIIITLSSSPPYHYAAAAAAARQEKWMSLIHVRVVYTNNKAMLIGISAHCHLLWWWNLMTVPSLQSVVH